MADSGTSTLNVDVGDLTVTSGLATDNMRVGFFAFTGTTTNSLSVLGGAVAINGTGNILIGHNSTGTGTNLHTSTVDFSATTGTSITAGTIQMGYSTNGTAGTTVVGGLLKLSITGTNDITATSITLGDSANSGNTAIPSVITLGDAINNINTDTLTLGLRKSSGGILFNSTGGTLNLAGTGVGSPTTTLNLANNTASGTGVGATGIDESVRETFSTAYWVR